MSSDDNTLKWKARRVHMSAQLCYEFSQSSGGASRLINPSTYKTSSKDPNYGLYPRERYKRREHGQRKDLGNHLRRMGNMLRGNQPIAGPSSAVTDVASIAGDTDCHLQDFLDDDILEGSSNLGTSGVHSTSNNIGDVKPTTGFQSAKLFMADSANTDSQSSDTNHFCGANKTKRLPKYLAQQPDLGNVWLKRRTVLPESASSSTSTASDFKKVVPGEPKMNGYSVNTLPGLLEPGETLTFSESASSSTSTASDFKKVVPGEPKMNGYSVNTMPGLLEPGETLTFSETDVLRSPSKGAVLNSIPHHLHSPQNLFSSASGRSPKAGRLAKASDCLKRTVSASELNSDSNESLSGPFTTSIKTASAVVSPKAVYSPSKRFKLDYQSFPTRRRNPKPVQKNTLFNYFAASPKKCSTVAESPSEATTKLESESVSADKVDKVDVENDIAYLCTVKSSNSKHCNKHQVSIISTSDVGSGSKDSSSSAQKDYDNLPEEFKDIYGLFGNMVDDNWETENETPVKEDPFQQLPNEVLEHIFCHFAMADLCLTLNRVCKRWCEIISREKFLSWKKTYNRLKKAHPETGTAIEAMCGMYEMTNAESCLVGLIRFMKSFKIRNIPNILSCLRWHPKYKWALALLRERLPDCLTQKEPDPWCVIVTLCILSHTVADILTIQACLTHPKSCCTTQDMMECLYCIATFFFHFKKQFGLNSGYHYRLYYALYLFENKGKVTVGELDAFIANTTGQQSIRKYGDRRATTRLTHEQLRIVNHNLQPNQVVKIVAFAGTGKTTTLIEFTKLWPSKAFLNVSYNKSVSEHAKKVFPRNVNCRTIHSLAWAGVGHRFKGKLKYKVTSFDVSQVLDGSNTTVRAARALKTIEKFVNTADPFITIAHVPERPMRISGDEPPPVPYSDQEKLEMAADATVVWESMKNPADYRTRVTHDVYLKLYQLSHPTIASIDCLLIDEAQDCNGAMLDVITSQRCPKILVGDPHQQIYSFRGAVNALASVVATHVYYLTQSFRFGPEIGYVASCALEVMKKEHEKTIVGGTHTGGFDGQEEGQVAIIARTNTSLFLEAVRLCCHGNKTILGAFLGGIKTYNFNQIGDIYKLMLASNGEGTRDCLGIKDNFIKRFSSFAKLVDYAKKADDVELLGKIKLVQLFGHRLLEMITKITEQCSHPQEMAEYVFSTAHKSKGHEFDTVRLTEDYVSQQFRVFNQSLEYIGRGPDLDEANILYVAITRAKKRLILTPQLIIMLLTAGESFEVPQWTEDLKNQPCYENGKWTCISCQRERKQSTDKVLTVTRKNITTTRLVVPSGLLCYVCSTMSILNLSDYQIAHELRLFGPEYIHSPTHEAFRQLVGPLSADEVEEAEKYYADLAEEQHILLL